MMLLKSKKISLTETRSSQRKKISILVPTLQRGNACLDAPASSPLHRTLERPHMRSHAGAWEQESLGGNYACF